MWHINVHEDPKVTEQHISSETKIRLYAICLKTIKSKNSQWTFYVFCRSVGIDDKIWLYDDT